MSTILKSVQLKGQRSKAIKSFHSFHINVKVVDMHLGRPMELAKQVCFKTDMCSLNTPKAYYMPKVVVWKKKEWSYLPGVIAF